MHDLPKLALSIRQPWAWAIMHAGKGVENRDWATKYRGQICIHAAKACSKKDYLEAVEFIQSIGIEWPLDVNTLDRGGIIGTAELVDCVSASESPWFFGKYGFVLKNPKATQFIPVNGKLGFFDWRKSITIATSEGL